LYTLKRKENHQFGNFFLKDLYFEGGKSLQKFAGVLNHGYLNSKYTITCNAAIMSNASYRKSTSTKKNEIYTFTV
jgi:hypothetical protein